MTDHRLILQAVHERRMAALAAGELDPLPPGESHKPTAADLEAAQALAGPPGLPAARAVPGVPARMGVPCPLVAIVNRSTVASDSQIAALVPALQTQVGRDFLPHWGSFARLVFCGRSTPAPSGAWQVVICDDSDTAGALGYHDTTAEGLPLGKVFWGTDLKYGQLPSVTLSHELLELLADPLIQTVAFLQDAQGVILYAQEICDPCEADALGYEIDGVVVSDFVLPAWFNPFLDDKAQTSFRNSCAGPFRLAPGGYIATWTTTVGWSQYSAEKLTYQQRPGKGTRRERRVLARNQWQRSLKQ